MKLTKFLPYPIGCPMFYLSIPVVYGKMNKVTVARLTGNSLSDQRIILQINPKYNAKLSIENLVSTCAVRVNIHQVVLNKQRNSKEYHV